MRGVLNPWIARVGTVAKILQARLDRYACAARRPNLIGRHVNLTKG